jgi:hypothetical protein
MGCKNYSLVDRYKRFAASIFRVEEQDSNHHFNDGFPVLLYFRPITSYIF